MDKKKAFVATVVVVCLVFLSMSAWAGSRQVGEVAYVRGAVTAGPEGGEVRFLGKGMPLYEGDVLTTAERSFVIINLIDGAKMTLRPETVFALEEYTHGKGEEKALMRMFRGGIRAVTGLIAKLNPKKGYNIHTPTAVLGVRGTEFDARLCEEGECFAEVEKAEGRENETTSPLVGRVVRLVGQLTAHAQDGTERVLLKGGAVYEGDILETGPGDRAMVVFRDNSRVTLQSESRFKVEEYKYRVKKGGTSFFRALKGGLRVLTGLMSRRDPGSFKLGTPTAVVGVRGTGFDVQLCENGCAAEAGKVAGRVVHLKGSVKAQSKDGTERNLIQRDPVYEGDTLETGPGGMAVVVFHDNSRVTMQAETIFKVEKYQYQAKKGDSVFFRMLRGGLRVFTGLITQRDAKGFKIGTPTAVVGVRGTGFDLLYMEEPGSDEQALLGKEGFLKRLVANFMREAIAAAPKGTGTLAFVWKDSKHAVEITQTGGKTLVIQPGQTGFVPKLADPFKVDVLPVGFNTLHQLPKPDPNTLPADMDKLFGAGPGEYFSVWDGSIEVEGKLVSEGQTVLWQKEAGKLSEMQFPLFPTDTWRPDQFSPDMKNLFGVEQLTKVDRGLYVNILSKTGEAVLENKGGELVISGGESAFVHSWDYPPQRVDMFIQETFPPPWSFNVGKIREWSDDGQGGKRWEECLSK